MRRVNYGKPTVGAERESETVQFNMSQGKEKKSRPRLAGWSRSRAPVGVNAHRLHHVSWGKSLVA